MLLTYCVSRKITGLCNNSYLTKSFTLRNIHNAKRKSRDGSLVQYMLSSYMRFIERFTRMLETRFPTTIQTYRQFVWGTKDFYGDLKQYLVIVKKKNFEPAGLRSLSRHELELYHKMPKDIVKITPLLVLSMLPMAMNVVLPLVYCFPRQLLTSQFWNLQQRVQFNIHLQKKRVRWYKPVFRSLQAQLDSLESHPLYRDWEYVIRLLGSGLHPEPDKIIKCLPIFIGPPYHTRKIYTSHVRNLLRMHNMHMGLYPRARLEFRAKIIHLMDKAIVKEGGVKSLTVDELRWACSFRGLNPTNMKTEDLVKWLNDWLTISNAVDKYSWSLLLHCPVLLSYNQPSNWILIH